MFNDTCLKYNGPKFLSTLNSNTQIIYSVNLTAVSECDSVQIKLNASSSNKKGVQTLLFNDTVLLQTYVLSNGFYTYKTYSGLIGTQNVSDLVQLNYTSDASLKEYTLKVYPNSVSLIYAKL